eukprot:1912131-Amphidinium_carterae.1
MTLAYPSLKASKPNLRIFFMVASHGDFRHVTCCVVACLPPCQARTPPQPSNNYQGLPCCAEEKSRVRLKDSFLAAPGCMRESPSRGRFPSARPGVPEQQLEGGIYMNKEAGQWCQRRCGKALTNGKTIRPSNWWKSTRKANVTLSQVGTEAPPCAPDLFVLVGKGLEGELDSEQWEKEMYPNVYWMRSLDQGQNHAMNGTVFAKTTHQL